MEKINLEKYFQDTVEILSDLISFETVSGTSNKKLIDYCEEKLKKCGATSFRTTDNSKQRINLFSTLKSKDNNNLNGIILSGHTDVVPASKTNWNTNPFIATTKENKIYGRGSCDMKGFIACSLAIAPLLASKNLNKPIHFSFTYDEETACQGAPILISELKKRNIKSSICIVGEPTNMKAVDAHKGCYEYSTHFTGLAAHGSNPKNGVNAIEYATKFINKLIELRNELKKKIPKDSIFTPPYTTLQIGRINGGLARNIIADKCSIDWELRPVVPEDGDFVNKNIDKYVKDVLLPEMKETYPQSKIEKEIIGEIIGFNKDNNSDAVNLICNLTGDNSREVVSFGTEAGLFQEIGISTVVCGPGSIEQAHKINEFISFDQIKRCLKMFVDLREKLIC